MSANVNNQYDFFKLVNLDANGNIGVTISGATGAPSSNPFAFTAPNYTALLSVTGMTSGDLAYVENSEGTQYLPGTMGGSYYPNGIYVYTTSWISDRNSIALTLSQGLQAGYEYDESIITDGTNGPVSITSGTGDDTDNVFEINNNASGTTASIDGNGNITANSLSATSITGTTIVGSDYLIAGNAGIEADEININGVNYKAALKVGDIGGVDLAQTIIQRHSTTIAPILIGARSNTNNEIHSGVTAAGTTSDGPLATYDLFGSIDLSVDSVGTISTTSAPGQIRLSVTPNGGQAPQLALKIGNDKLAAFQGSVTGTDFNGVALTDGGVATKFLDETGAYSTPANEITTVSNIGGGTGLFSGKTGVDLEFKTLTSTGGTVSISSTGATVNIEAFNDPRVTSAASTATLTVDTSLTDQSILTAQERWGLHYQQLLQ